MTGWLCFRCFNPEYICEIEIPTRNAVRKIVREELDNVSQVVEEAVKNALPKSSFGACTVEDVTSVVASYAEATQRNQKKAIEEVTVTQKKAIEEINVAQTAQTVAEKVARKIDEDNVEREKRRFSVVIMNVPESKSESGFQKREDDLQFCREKLEMKEGDYETCWRAGRLEPNKSEYNRPLVVKLKSKQDVDYFTDHGRGYRTKTGFWINKDLCAVDRIANFQARQQRREREHLQSKEEHQMRSSQ